MGGYRWWCFTNFKLDFDYDALMAADGAPTWIGYGAEVCPKTGRDHHQGYCYFKQQAKSVKNVAAMLGKCHVEPCKGSPEQNDNYCKKEGDWHEFGDKPAQGKRTDLIDRKDEIANGKTSVDEIAMEDPMMFHQYGRTLSKIEDIALRKKFRTWMTEGEWVHGPTGTGKSDYAFKDFDPETHYVYPNDGGWWDGYTGQETVIIDDFRGDMTYHELLTLVDKYPKTVRRRNREPVPFLAKTVIVTSALPPDEVYRNLSAKDKLDQLYRRFKICASEVVGGNTAPDL